MGLRLPWTRTEKRSSSFEGLVTNAIVQAASGGAITDPDGLAAVEVASGLIGRTFAGAVIGGDRFGLMTPRVLEMIGRELVRRGESLFSIEGGPGMMSLVPAGTWDIRGPSNPAGWWYRVDTFGASDHKTKLIPGGAVLHARINVDPVRPWLGRSPVHIAATTASTAAKAESSAGAEVSLPASRLLPFPGNQDQAKQVAENLSKGGVTVTPSNINFASVGAEPSSRYAPQLLHPDPAPGHVSLRSQSALDVVIACGIPPTMLDPKSQGQALREGFRQLENATLKPWARLVEQEVREKLDSPDFTITFDDLFAGDIAGRAKAFQAMVSSGRPMAEAVAVTGLMIPEDMD